jgi:hypothetical protein
MLEQNLSHCCETAGKATGTPGTPLNVTVPALDIVSLRWSTKRSQCVRRLVMFINEGYR